MTNDDPGHVIQRHCWQTSAVKFAAVYEKFGRFPTDSVTQAVVAVCVCLQKNVTSSDQAIRNGGLFFFFF